MPKSRAISAKPSLGGRLMSGLSSEQAGLSDYTIKRDFRRVLEGETRAEGFDAFAPNPLLPSQPPTNGEPITLVKMLREPNGRVAVVVGTQTTLWRYFGMDNGAYYADDYIALDYFDSNPGVWVTIGSGFSSNAMRWEAVEINGYLVLNNGVDLPVTYQVQDLAVEPIYELREQGIASVGTIAEHNGILLCGDLRQINADKLTEIMTPLSLGVIGQAGLPMAPVLGKVNSGTDGVAGNLLTLEGDYALAPGQTLRMANGLACTVMSVLDCRSAQVDGLPNLAEPAQHFYLTGPAGNGQVLSLTVEELPAAAQNLKVGQRLFFESGDVRTITALGVAPGWQPPQPPATSIMVDVDSPIGACGCYLENPAAYTVFSDSSYIERYHWRLIWSMPGQPRRFGAVIPCTVSPQSDVVELTYPARSLVNGMSVLIANAGSDGGNLTAAISWTTPLSLTLADGAMHLASSQALAALASAKAAEQSALNVLGSTQSTLKVAKENQALAQAASDAKPSDTDLSAALTAASLSVDTAQNNVTAAQKAYDDAVAARQNAQTNSITTTQLTAADAAQSITGNFEDLQGDGSGILKALTLGAYLVIYKESEIFLAQYTANLAQPFSFQPIKIPEGAALWFRNTVVAATVGAIPCHLYAGKSAIYQFDLWRGTPQEMAVFQPCQDILFNAPTSELLGPDLMASNLQVAPGAGRWIVDDLDSGATYQVNVNSLVRNVTPNAPSPNAPSPNLPGRMCWYQFYEDEFFTYDEHGESVPVPITFRQVLAQGTDFVFAAENPITKEIWICFPYATTEDKALRFDYRFNTLSTTSICCTAAAAVKRPESSATIGNLEDWFILGTPEGKIMRYGLLAAEPQASGSITASKAGGSNLVGSSAEFFTARMVGRSIQFSSGRVFAITGFVSPNVVQVLGDGDVTNEAFTVIGAIYHRDGQSYESVLQSGMADFGSPDNTKRMDQYVLFLSSNSPGTPLQLALRSGVNPAAAADALTTTIQAPQTHNLVPVILLGYYLGDRLTISGMNNPAKITGRMFSVAGADSHSLERR